MKFYVYVGLATVTLLSLWSCAVEQPQPLKSEEDHFIVIGIDGLSIDGLLKAETPRLDQMIAEGASTLNARSVLPSSSSPNWASMIMGAGPEQHGITSNAWQPDEHLLPASVVTKSQRFPTVFTLFKAQRPDAIIGAVYDWSGFGRLFDKSEVDFDLAPEDEMATVTAAIEILRSKKPQFTFIHLDHVDHAGHSQGHGSESYYESISLADSLVNAIVEATKLAGMYDRTTFLIASDHGGVGFGHGGESSAEMYIPFILYGHQVKKGYSIQTPVNQFDQAATVAYAFGLEMPYAWIGKPIEHAFLGNTDPMLTYKPKQAEVDEGVKRLVTPSMFSESE
jgi:predicted AlkP superfamily pyrophosphatase or phosphodiesterase